MAISRVGTAGTGTNSVTFPTHQAGDLLIVAAYRDGNATAPTLPAGWVSAVSGGANSNSMRVGWRIAVAAGTTSGTWTNASSCIGVVYRNASVGVAGQQGAGSSSTFSFDAISIGVTNGTSWVAGFVGSSDGTGVAAVGTAPTNMTNHQTVSDATDREGAHDTNTGVTSWTTQTVAAGISSNWRTAVVEIVDETPAANTVGYTTVGGSGMSNGVITLCEFTPSVTGTIDKIKVVAQDNIGAGNEIRVAAYSKPVADPSALLFHSTAAVTTVDGGIHIYKFTAFTNDNGTPAVTSGTPIYLAEFDNSGGGIAIYYDAGSAAQTRLEDTGTPTYPTWPDPIDSNDVGNQFSRKLSFWAEVTPAAGGNTTNFFF